MHDRAIVFAKELNGLTLEKNMCVSFKQEEGAKGPLAKDIRQEDPDRVARITAKVHYGIVEVPGARSCLITRIGLTLYRATSTRQRRSLPTATVSSLHSVHLYTEHPRSK